MRRQYLLGLTTALALTLGGCTSPGDVSKPTPSGSTIPTAPALPTTPVGASEAPTAPSGEFPTADPTCIVTDEQVSLFARDWERVTSSVGRPDHVEYTAAMVDTMQTMSRSGAECVGADKLPTMTSLLDEIHKAAQEDTASADQIHEFNELGNEWLVGLGFTPRLIE